MAIGRKIIKEGDVYQFKGSEAPYSNNFDSKINALRVKNSFNWDIYPINSV